MKKKPFVLNTHGSLLGYRHYLKPGRQQFPYRLYDALTLKTAAKRAEAVVVSSPFEYGDALEFGIDKQKLHVIPAGIDPREPVSGAEKNRDGPLQILFAGRVARVRRLELILQALAGTSFPWRLTVAGGEETTHSGEKPGYAAELKRLARDLGIDDRVTFAGPQTPEALNSFYDSSDVLVYPSRYENFGQPLLEAAAAGLPIIATPVGVARDLVEDGVTGFLVPADPGAIRGCLGQLTDADRRRARGKKIREKAIQNYGWDRIIRQYIELYNSL